MSRLSAGVHLGASASSTTMHMGAMAHPASNLHTILTDWQTGPFPLGVAVVLVALAVWYLLAVHKLAVAHGRHWHKRRTLSFFLGLVAIELALGSSVASMSMWSFASHIMQHLLLMIMAPPLLAMGAPMTLILQTSSKRVKTYWLKALHSVPFALLRHPVTVFFLYYLSMYAFFLTGALGYAMNHMWSMDLINVGFLLGATLFWWPMVGSDPIPGDAMSPGFKLLNLLIGVPVEAFLGIAILEMKSPIASMYTLSTTHVGGAILWSASEVATIMALLPVYFQWVRSDAQMAKRVDARIAAGTLEEPDFEGKGMAGTLRALRRDH